jgi:hypothetical protein
VTPRNFRNLHYITLSRTELISNLGYNDGHLRLDIEKFFCNKNDILLVLLNINRNNINLKVPRTLTKTKT